MKRMSIAPTPLCRSLAGIVVAGACVLAMPVASVADPATAPPGNAANGAGQDDAAGRAGQRIHVDPHTGKRIAPPASTTVVPDPALSTSHQGLVEEAAPGGGVMVDLKGRFRHAESATVSPDGKATVDCVPPGTAAHHQEDGR